MPLPRAIEEQERRADELQQALIASQQEGDEPSAGEAAAAEPARPEPNTEAATPQPPAQPTAPATPATEDPAPWEQRYRVLSGKYNAEVPRLHATVNQLRGELDTLRKTLAERQPELPKLLKPEEIDRYGEEFVDVVRRAAKEVAAEMVASKDGEIAQLRARLDNAEATTQRVSRETFFSTLSKAAPDWRQHNDDARFLGWLAENDPYSGRARQELLDEAVAAGDAERAARFFTAYRGQAPAATSPAASLETQIQPRGNGSSPAPQPQQRKLWKRAEIDSFYRDLQRGKYKDAEALALENDINAAVAEGRVVDR